jgi:hypothetical protein
VKAAIGALLMTSMGCAPVPSDEPEAPVHGAGDCDAAPAQKLVGREATKELGAEALQLSGARSLRWIPKDGVVTMDYRTDRLNLHLDSANKVVKITCG